MIKLYSGTPGSGKSLHTAKVIWNRLRNGKTVIANFEINTEAISETFVSFICRKLHLKFRTKPKKIGKFIFLSDIDMTASYLIKYAKENHKSKRENQTLLIIDECGRKFNSRAWDSKDRMSWIDFFQLHRHIGYNVILVAQQDRMIDRQIRGFVEYEIKHRLINNFHMFGKLLGVASGGKLFIAIEYWYGVRERISAEFFKIDRSAGIYDSFKDFTEEAQTGVQTSGLGGSLFAIA